jgi:hypothetical protein
VPGGRLTTFLNVISLIGKYRRNVDHMVVVNAILNPEIDIDDICMPLPDKCPEGSMAPQIILRQVKAVYGLKQASWLWHDDINAF